jgi:hypothetical protein
MLTITPLTDNKAVLVVRIDLDAAGYLYFSDALDKITLSGIDFDGKVIYRNSISDIQEGCDITQGGGIGSVGNFSFSIARYNSYTGVSNFHEDVYPAAEKPLLTAKTVDVGICWLGATSLSDITWLNRYYIEDHSWDVDKIDLSCVAYDELTPCTLPPYKIQDELDNGISYYEDATDETKENVIPIIYGDFTNINTGINFDSIYDLAPIVKTGKNLNFKVACHLCHTIDIGKYIYEYFDGSTARLGCSGSSNINTWGQGHSIRIRQTTEGTADPIYALAIIQPIDFSSDTPFPGIKYPDTIPNAYDGDATTYMRLQPGEKVAFTFKGDLSDTDLGYTSSTVGINADAFLQAFWKPIDNNVSDQIKIHYYHPQKADFSNLYETQNYSSGTAIQHNALAFGQGTSAYPQKMDNSDPWGVAEAQSLYMVIEAPSGNPTDILIYNVIMRLSNVGVYGVASGNVDKYKLNEFNKWFANQSPFSLDVAKAKSMINNLGEIKKANVSNCFVYVKGLWFDGWIA